VFETNGDALSVPSQNPCVDNLPNGWTIDRIRTLLPNARLLPLDTYVVVLAGDDYDEIKPIVIVGEGGDREGETVLLVEEGCSDWLMGIFDKSDGSIVCWGSYGDDLEAAIRSM
jgi:hypothetical protein